MAGSRAYWVRTANWTTRERMAQNFYRLNETWCYSKDRRGRISYWHTVPTPEKKPEHQQYVTFERQRWHRAGDPYIFYGQTRKTCEICKKRIPIPIRVIFDLKER